MTSKRAKRRQRGYNRGLTQHMGSVAIDISGIRFTLPIMITINVNPPTPKGAMEQLQQALASEGFQTAVTQVFESFMQSCVELSQHGESLHGGKLILQPNHQCYGCQNWHGQVYNGVSLICAMHPYGSESKECPDWKSGMPTQEPTRITPF